MKITDPKTQLGPEYHGRVLKVGKKNFVRIVHENMYKWWEDGFQEMSKATNRETGEDEWIYRKGEDWFRES